MERLERTVLFDTGKTEDILLHNMHVLQIEPEDIDLIVLSRAHGDHTGGLPDILACNPDITVYYPASFPEEFDRSIRVVGAQSMPVDVAVSPLTGLLITSPLGGLGESSLLVATAQGYVLVTGRAHPGLVETVAAASDLVGGPVFTAVGGFHLMSHSTEQVDRVVHELRELGVERCGPAHCTGELAAARMKAALADGFIKMGVSSTINF